MTLNNNNIKRIKTDSPLVSVFLPYYNDRDFLRSAIESVLNQTYTNFELILLNHATTDDSREIAHSYNDNRIIHIDMTKNYGAGGGILFEQFVQVSKGKYLKPTCADDILMPNCLEKLVNYMENNPDKDFTFGNAIAIDLNSNQIGDGIFFEHYGFNINNNETDELKLLVNGIGHTPYPASIFKKSTIEKIPINKILIMEFDMSLYAYILLNGGKIGFSNEPVVWYRLHEAQMSSNKNDASRIDRINDLELIEFLRIFLSNIKSVDLVKQIYPNAKYIELLNDENKDLIPFVIALYYATHQLQQAKVLGRTELYKMLDNEVLAKKIQNEFNFDIKDFRDIYTKDRLFVVNNIIQQVIQNQETEEEKEQEKSILTDNKPQKQVSFLQKIFSIKNEYNKKVIRIIGFKIKLAGGK